MPWLPAWVIKGDAISPRVASLFHNGVMTLTFDLILLAWITGATDYVCVNFGLDSSSRFPSTVQTHRHTHTHTKSQTQLITLHTAWPPPIWVI